MENNQERDLNMKESSENEQITESVEQQGRREVVQKLGKFAAYAAPFTVLAFTKKASAASGHGPGKHP
ncbi:MAG TPA: hypothetical protein VGG97_11535 [Bryobacteraceae bacterium]|jgi:hypothetical protein